MHNKDHIIQATMACFQSPGPQALSSLESLLAKDADVLMSQCVGILQTANTILAEEGIALAEIFSQQGTPLVCKTGCSGCCHQLVLCQPFEAHTILAYLAANPQKLHDFRAAYALWDKATVTVRQSYLDWAVNRYGQGEDDGKHEFMDYLTPCPFLNAEGLCNIYPVRPYGCRTCVALDPACSTPATGQSGTLHLQYSLYTGHHHNRMAITRMLLRCLGAKSAPVPMPEMLAAACL